MIGPESPVIHSMVIAKKKDTLLLFVRHLI